MKYTTGWLISLKVIHTVRTSSSTHQSPTTDITASIVQRSAVGPAAYVVNASDHAATPRNEL